MKLYILLFTSNLLFCMDHKIQDMQSYKLNKQALYDVIKQRDKNEFTSLFNKIGADSLIKEKKSLLEEINTVKTTNQTHLNKLISNTKFYGYSSAGALFSLAFICDAINQEELANIAVLKATLVSSATLLIVYKLKKEEKKAQDYDNHVNNLLALIKDDESEPNC